MQFHVHKALVCRKSPFFSAACSGNCKEGHDNTIRLPTAEPEIFQIYLHWVYTSTINLRRDELEVAGDISSKSALASQGTTKVPFKATSEKDGAATQLFQSITFQEPYQIKSFEELRTEDYAQDRRDSNSRGQSDDPVQTLFKTYILADQLLDRPLKNADINLYLRLAGGLKRYFSTSSFALVCANTSSDSGLHRCLIDCAAADLPLKRVPMLAELVTKDTLIELVSRQVELRGVPREDYVPKYERRCEYHEHEEGEKCYAS